jgi:nucleotide-binding universal stress UspA family protein
MPTETSPAKIGKILVAVDGSDYAERAGLTAVDLAVKYSAELGILHVADYPPNVLGVGSSHTVPVGIPMSDPDVDRQRKRAMDSIERIEAFASKHGIEANSEILQTSDSNSARIVDYAYRENIDLIVAGNLGLNSYQTSILGSVSNGILNKARCSVMVVR